MAMELTSDNFDTEVLKFEGVVLVDFWAGWCGPCKMLGPVIEEVSKELEGKEGAKVGKLNVDENADIAQKYSIMSIPALKFFNGGKVVDELVGLQSKEALIEKINEITNN